MPLHDTHYKKWDGKRQGIWSRRWVIVKNGIRLTLDSKWSRYFIMISWLVGLIQATILFGIGQLLVPDSSISNLIESASPGVQAATTVLTGWLKSHPEVSVHTTYNVLFYLFTSLNQMSTFFIIVMTLPHLISKDLSSQAILVYSSKALSRWDYILGKFGVIMGMLTIGWLGPNCMAWLLGNFLAPDWSFFWHSRMALVHTVTYIGCCMLALSVIALGISAMSSNEKSIGTVWALLWFVGGAFAPLAKNLDRPSLQYISLSLDMKQWCRWVFDLEKDLDLLEKNAQGFGETLSKAVIGTNPNWLSSDITGALIGVGVFTAIAAYIIWSRVKPE